MVNLRDPKSVIKAIALGLFLIAIIVNSPWLYQQGKNFGAELYRATQGSRK
jgi:hypothetical protein